MIDALSELRRRASGPAAIALSDGETELSYAELRARVDAAAARLARLRCRRLGLLLDNGLDWAVFDLAARQAEVVLVPIPSFFSDAQIGHVIRAAGLDHLVTDQPSRVTEFIARDPSARAADPVLRPSTRLLAIVPDVLSAAQALPRNTGKITFTSGTTGTPKGICLSHQAIDRVAESLLAASAGSRDDRHLCLLPLATLLENISGIHVPLLAGATSYIPPLRDVGLSGSSQLDIAQLIGAILRFRATTIVMVPQMLQALVSALSSAAAEQMDLRLIAVGGAPIAPDVLRQAEEIGLPVREGYGLSECSSVVSFNTPVAHRMGSVGRPLPHVDLRLAPDGEILVGGAVCEGVLGDDPQAGQPQFWPTGDLGRIDADGYLYVTGRKKNMFITAFGRNVAPEWIECELTIEPTIAQAAVFGEARPWNAAVIVPRPARHAGATAVDPAAIDPAAIAAAIQRTNARLPDYARIGRWLIADAPFTPANDLATANGRLRRERLAEVYRDRLARLYESEDLRVS